MIVYAETTPASTTSTTKIQTTPFLMHGPNITIGENIRKYMYKTNRMISKISNRKSNVNGYRKLNYIDKKSAYCYVCMV